MSQTSTGKNRLRGGLKAGWTLSHKTGTGQVLGATQAGYNDIGILTAPDGRSYSVAVMIKKTSTPLGVAHEADEQRRPRDDRPARDALQPDGLALAELTAVAIRRNAGAGEGIRTLDPNLGKVVLYP